MTDGVNLTGVNKISVHSMNTFMNLPHQFPKHIWLFPKMFLPFILKLKFHKFYIWGDLEITNLHPAQEISTDFPATFSCNIFLQDFPELDPDWLAPHHPILNAKFLPITAFLKLVFFPSSLSCKIFPQEFSTKFSCKIFLQDFPELDPD